MGQFYFICLTLSLSISLSFSLPHNSNAVSPAPKRHATTETRHAQDWRNVNWRGYGGREGWSSVCDGGGDEGTVPSDECLTAETRAWGSILFLKYYCHRCYRPRVISPPGNDAMAARKQHSEICHVRVCSRASRGDEYCNTLPGVYSGPRVFTTRRAGEVIGPIYRSNDIFDQTWLRTERKNNLKRVTLFLFLTAVMAVLRYLRLYLRPFSQGQKPKCCSSISRSIHILKYTK